MTDEARKPPRAPTDREQRELTPRRMPKVMSDDERANIGRESRRSPAMGTPVLVEDEDSAAHDVGEERAEFRARRPTSLRLSLLEEKGDKHEEKLDEVVNKVHALGLEVANQSGQITIAVKAMENATAAMIDRTHVKFTTEMDVGKAQAMDIIDANKAERDDTLHKAKSWRDWIGKAMGIAGALVALVTAAFAAGRC